MYAGMEATFWRYFYPNHCLISEVMYLSIQTRLVERWILWVSTCGDFVICFATSCEELHPFSSIFQVKALLPKAEVHSYLIWLLDPYMKPYRILDPRRKVAQRFWGRSCWRIHWNIPQYAVRIRFNALSSLWLEFTTIGSDLMCVLGQYVWAGLTFSTGCEIPHPGSQETPSRPDPKIQLDLPCVSNTFLL